MLSISQAVSFFFKKVSASINQVPMVTFIEKYFPTWAWSSNNLRPLASILLTSSGLFRIHSKFLELLSLNYPIFTSSSFGSNSKKLVLLNSSLSWPLIWAYPKNLMNFSHLFLNTARCSSSYWSKFLLTPPLRG